MASLKSNGSTTSGPQEPSSDAKDDDRSELCPGFKDVDAFVKVSDRPTVDAEFLISS